MKSINYSTFLNFIYKLRTNIKLTPTQDNYLKNTSIYMSLAELRQKRELNFDKIMEKKLKKVEC